MSDNAIVWVNTPLRDTQVQAEFKEVKRYLGIRSNADVVRALIREKAREIRRDEVVCEGEDR